LADIPFWDLATVYRRSTAGSGENKIETKFVLANNSFFGNYLKHACAVFLFK
jgi:hypothetical protein